MRKTGYPPPLRDNAHAHNKLVTRKKSERERERETARKSEREHEMEHECECEHEWPFSASVLNTNARNFGRRHENG